MWCSWTKGLGASKIETKTITLHYGNYGKPEIFFFFFLVIYRNFKKRKWLLYFYSRNKPWPFLRNFLLDFQVINLDPDWGRS